MYTVQWYDEGKGWITWLQPGGEETFPNVRLTTNTTHKVRKLKDRNEVRIMKGDKVWKKYEPWIIDPKNYEVDAELQEYVRKIIQIIESMWKVDHIDYRDGLVRAMKRGDVEMTMDELRPLACQEINNTTWSYNSLAKRAGRPSLNPSEQFTARTQSLYEDAMATVVEELDNEQKEIACS